MIFSSVYSIGLVCLVNYCTIALSLYTSFTVIRLAKSG